MAKAALKLLGTQRAWAPDVRLGLLTRTDSAPEPVSIRVTPVAATDETLALARAVASALSPVAGLLPLITAVATNGCVGRVYERAEGVSAAVLLEALRARAQVIPSRVAVEIAAQVARTLVDVQEVRDGGWRGAHLGCAADEVIVGVGGALALAGATLEWEGGPSAVAPVRPSFAPPEGGFSGGVYMVGALLVELLSGSPPPVSDPDPARHEAATRKAVIRVLARPGDIPGDAVGKILLRSLTWDPAARGELSALARTLAELSQRLPGPTLVTWAPDAVGHALQAVLSEPSVPPSNDTRPAPAAPPAAAPAAAPPVAPPAPAERPRAPAYADTYQDDDETGLDRGAMGVAGAVDPGVEIDRAAAGAGDPALLGSGPAIAIGGDARPVAGPRAVRVQPLGSAGPLSGGPTLADMEGVRAAPVAPVERSNSLVTAVATVCLGAFMVTLLGAGWFWFVRVPTESVETLPVEAAPAAPAEAPPVEPPPAGAPVETPPVAAPVAPPVAAPVAAPVASPAAAPAPTAAAVPQGKPAPASPPAPVATARPSTPAPEPTEEVDDPDEPVRIGAAPATSAPATSAPATSAPATSAPATAAPATPATTAPASTPAAATTTATAAAPTPAAPGPYAISFTSGDPSITSLEVRCPGHSGAGSGVVSVPAVDGGTACRVTGLGGDAPLLAVVTVTADRSYTCFRGRSRSCQ